MCRWGGRCCPDALLGSALLLFQGMFRAIWLQERSVSPRGGKALGYGHRWQEVEPFSECSREARKHEKREFTHVGSVFLNAGKKHISCATGKTNTFNR